MDTHKKKILTQVYCEVYVKFLENIQNKIEEAKTTAGEVRKDYENAETIEERKYLENIFFGIMDSVKGLSKALRD